MLDTRILIVDDDPAAHAGLALLLRGEGYVVDRAESAPKAFEMVTAEPPDVVLTDLQMPGMDGIALCRALRAVHPNLPVIVVTGFSDITTAVRALQSGAEDYLAKPVDFDELVVSIQRAIERRAATVERQQLRARTQELYQQTLSALRAHEEVLSIVSHNLRNPLNVILLWAQQLQSGSLGASSPEARSGAAVVQRNAMRMERLIADLLDESRRRAPAGTPRASRPTFLRRGSSDSSRRTSAATRFAGKCASSASSPNTMSRGIHRFRKST